MARLLAAITDESAAGLRLRTLVLAYLLTGRRRSEVLNLRWRDLDLEGGFYRYTGKGGKERQRALPPPVVTSLDELAANILAFQAYYEVMVRPFEWRFTRAHLAQLFQRLASKDRGHLAGAA